MAASTQDRSALDLSGSGLRDLLRQQAAAVPPAGRFAWLVTAAHTWILVGLFLDGWFHINGPEVESFFTPWHGVLYGGVLATVVVHLREQRRAGGTAPGYAPSLVGGVVVLAAGMLDAVWHTLSGVEADLEALLSPPHLLLITAGTLVFAGPLRAALRAPAGSAGGLPTALSAAYVVTGLAFFTQYSSPFTQLYPASLGAGTDLYVRELREVAGVAGLIVFSVLVGGALALLKTRTVVVPGSLAVVVAVPSLFLVTQQNRYSFVPAIVLVALLVELLGRRLSPSAAAAGATAALAAGWVLTMVTTREVAWSGELLSGSIGSAAAAGYLMGWVVQQSSPRVPVVGG